MRADAILDPIGLSIDDPYAAIIDTERVGADLGHCGRKPLPDIGAAGHQLDRACGVDTDARAVDWAEPAFVDKNADPGPHQFAGSAALSQLRLQRLPADLRQRLIEQ